MYSDLLYLYDHTGENERIEEADLDLNLAFEQRLNENFQLPDEEHLSYFRDEK